MRRYRFVGGDEPGEAVGFGVGYDETVERIAGPLFVEGGARDLREREIAEADAEFVLHLVLNVAGGAFAALDFVKELKLKQNHLREKQIGLLEQAVDFGAETGQAAVR